MQSCTEANSGWVTIKNKNIKGTERNVSEHSSELMMRKVTLSAEPKEETDNRKNIFDKILIINL